MSHSESSVSSANSEQLYERTWVSNADPIFQIYDDGFDFEHYEWVLKTAPERQPIAFGRDLTFLQWFLQKNRKDVSRLLSAAPPATQESLGKVYERVSLRRTLSFDNWCWQEAGPEIDLLFGRGDGLEEPSWVFATGNPLRIITGCRLASGCWLEAGTIIRLE
ncbi:hypothetical protein KQX54_013783 [Cotesia glomerata]|uniref:Uncharacterized protein n=1 Tax=Cotesia glomerata TaxID=32391 RepID=A0AAV7HXD5_COTGL|nr:hypothetical protein KQX54_013783 [Cotesia glomerata]